MKWITAYRIAIYSKTEQVTIIKYFCQCHPNTLYYYVELKSKGSGCKQLKEKLQTLHMVIQKLLNLLRMCGKMNGQREHN